MAWKILGFIGTITLCAAAAGCSADENNGTSGTTGSTTGTSTTGLPDPTYTGIPLDPMNGWVAADTTGNLGIQGAFYTFSDQDDGGTTVVLPESFENAGGSICANGTAGQVQNEMYDIYWGGAVGFNLSQEEGVDTANPWNATAAGVTGFAFQIDNLPIGGELRFNLKIAGDDSNYCKKIASSGDVVMHFSDLEKSCWSPEAAAPDLTMVEALHWQVVTNGGSSYEFEFCVYNLVALTD